jgi:hypothetical protein
MTTNRAEQIDSEEENVAPLRSVFTITGTGVHVPPEQAFTITGIRSYLIKRALATRLPAAACLTPRTAGR